MKPLSTAIQEYNDDELLRYLQVEIENQGRQEELMEMMTWHNPDTEKVENCTSLQLALNYEKSNKVISKIINIGGRELLMMINGFGYTALHCEWL